MTDERADDRDGVLYEEDPEPVTAADLLELDVAEDDFDPHDAARDVAIDEELRAWWEEHKK